MHFKDIFYILAAPNLITLNLNAMNKITYLCFVILFNLSFSGFSQSSTIQRVRVDFVGPKDYTRHLLLAFTANDQATDGVDYGYDALIFDALPDELNWIIEDNRYVIQGVGKFDTTKYYPFGMFLTNSGEIEIALTALENFDSPIDVFIYDSVLNTFTSINDSRYIKTLSNGNYLDRFYITFTDNSSLVAIASGSNNALSISENEIHNTTLNYLNGSKELLVKTNTTLNLKSAKVYDVLGKKLIDIQNINSDYIKIPLSSTNTKSTLIVSLTTADGKVLNKRIIASN
jgi:hypothetical protein